MPLPVSLIIDDGACINLLYWLHPYRKLRQHIPTAFTAAFVELCRSYGVKGKFSVLPMPSGTGRIDEGLTHVPQRHLDEFLQIMREDIAPAFDITPELLTHQSAVDISSGYLMHLFEDEWVRRASVNEITSYLELAFRILRNVGLDPTGVTSPWDTGIHNEEQYAEAIGRAYHQVTGRTFAWYFLHCLGSSEPHWPWVTWQDQTQGLTVVTIPALTDDVYWMTQEKTTKAASRRVAWEGVDQLLTADGRTGKLRELYDDGYPLIILTHWQSLFSRGWWTGLDALGETCERIQRVFGDTVVWTRFSDLARTAVFNP